MFKTGQRDRQIKYERLRRLPPTTVLSKRSEASRRDAKHSRDAPRRSLRGGGFVMMLGVRLRRLIGVMVGVKIMRTRKMRMMAGSLMRAARRMFRRFAMMMRGIFVMLGRMLVMLGGVFGVSHFRLLVSAGSSRTRIGSAILRQESDERASNVYILRVGLAAG